MARQTTAKQQEYRFEQPVSEQIWQAKYRYVRAGHTVDTEVADTWSRVAEALTSNESSDMRNVIYPGLRDAFTQFKLLPAGRILAGAGTQRSVTLANTFVMNTLPDSLEGILDTVKEAALTMKMGGGLGYDFSTLRPRGDLVRGLDCPAAGPLAAMDICDSVCKMVVSGMGRGAMMATLRCDHPDIEDFIIAKSNPTRLRNFNVSVMVTDSFMEAVRQDKPWDLVWGGKTYETVSATRLWDMIMQQTYDAAEPGVLFIDRINALNPLSYCETISSTNSCAEQPLPPNGTCPLASINLARLVEQPFGMDAHLNLAELRRLASIAVRMLDNTLDISDYPIPAQAEEAHQKRRVGLGVTGLADALIMVGVPYGSDEAVALIDKWMGAMQNAAYFASAQLAAERGTFPMYDPQHHLERPNIKYLNHNVQQAIEKHGLRNGVLTSIAPTGTISMFAGNVSSGIEPVFATSYRRKIRRPDGTCEEEEVLDYAVWLYRQMFGRNAPLTDAFVTAQELVPADHVRMQAAAQLWIDSSISKTVNCPKEINFDDFKGVYLQAYASGCKGCTTYRPNDITGSILTT